MGGAVTSALGPGSPQTAPLWQDGAQPHRPCGREVRRGSGSVAAGNTTACECDGSCPIACALWVREQGPPGENWGCCHFSPGSRGGREKPGQGEEAVVPRQRWLL